MSTKGNSKKRREELINKLLREPIKFEKENGVEKLIKLVSFKHLRGIIKRIYDLNENQLVEE